MKSNAELACQLNRPFSPPLTEKQAEIEASRCYYCYDAPCIQACPTQIDIPSFIRKIFNGNTRGAAIDILSANILGGTCSRVCPVETLCQEACVREKSEGKPVEIGKLQRFATDAFFKTGEKPFHRRMVNQPLQVAIVGAGPAGLSCAHQLALLGYEITIFEAKEKSGGLNEYGLAPYKMVDHFAQKEIDFVLSVGGIEIRHGQVLGETFTLEELQKKYSAVFLGIGLGSVNQLRVPGEDLRGVLDAVRQIEKIRQTEDLKRIQVGQHVVVIGGGNTAIDIAIQMKRLGAEFVTIVYRRGEEHMGATVHEQELAQKTGVLIQTWAKPHQILGDSQGVHSIEFEYTEMDANGSVCGTKKFFKLKANQVFKAIGQTLIRPSLQISRGKIDVNSDFETSMPGVFAGGDCISAGEDLTVTAVQQGKLAALAIHRKRGIHG